MTHRRPCVAALVRSTGATLAALALTDCTPSSTPPPDASLPAHQAPGWDSQFALPVAMDTNPDPHVVEVHLDAMVTGVSFRAGQTTPAWTYNGSVPGPLIRANVGDRVIVHLANHLPEATTIHWHGVRVPNAMDGTPQTQAPVQPGGTFTYDFTVPDAGTYWYHPHYDSAAQVADGLYGALIVDDPSDARDFGDEVVMVLSDVLLNDDGSLAPPDAGGGFGDLWGREGNVILVNGRVDPRLVVRAGRRQRWRIINAARARYFSLGLAGHSFARIGGDDGLRDAPITSDTLRVVPGERADVTVVPQGSMGAEVPVQWLPYDRGLGTAFNRSPETVFTMALADLPAESSAPLPDALRAIAPIDPTGAHVQDVVITESMVGGQPQFQINGQPGWDMTPLPARVGETDRWHVVNMTQEDHPFHLHGFSFQVQGSATYGAHEWKDTVNLPRMQSLDLLVRYDARPGPWMFHCHILDHAEIGMMGTVQVAP